MLLAFAAIIDNSELIPEIRDLAISNQSVLSLLVSSEIPSHWHQEIQPGKTMASLEMYIKDVFSFYPDVLVLIHVPKTIQFPAKERVQCQYGGATHFTHRKALVVMHLLHKNEIAVLCSSPPQDLVWVVNSVLIEIDKGQKIRHGAATPEYQEPLPWNFIKVVFEAFAMERDVVVFVHGIKHPQGVSVSENAEQERLKKFQCIYGGYFEVPVTAQSQEVFRCAHPPTNLVPKFVGMKVAIRVETKILASVAYYSPMHSRESFHTTMVSRAAGEKSNPKLHHICACTMIFNGAKFLKEWVHYNHHLGVEKFYLYDNNSEDNLDEVIEGLRSFNIKKQPWPWVKTQEAGFSHCSLSAQSECTWMFYIDVDEYFFPNQHFLETGVKSQAPDLQPTTTSSSIIALFINEAAGKNSKVGQISIFCHNYGPSGFTASPPQGITQGYTCRIKKPERHKSLVLLDSVATNLSNVIHHFTLQDGYETKLMSTDVAVINHYKYQAWDEFKVKFRRRAATYVADWTENRNWASKDRVLDLGTKAVKPHDWESRYCEERDYGLRDYVRHVFGSYDDNQTLRLTWE